MKSVRIFVSSPGDVQAEREIAERVIHSLAGEFAGRLGVEGYFWEYEPMVVTSDFQDQIPRPSSFDIVVCILWSRLGSRLHTKHHRPDGRPYSSGTEYEFEDAAAANLESGEPDILLYLNRTPPPLHARTRAEREEALRQIDALEEFLDRWTRDAEGNTWKGAFTGYTDLARFEKLLEEHLRKLLQKRAPSAGIAEALPPATWKGSSPFRGLEAFDFPHAGIFFGRTRAIEDVLKILKRRHTAGDPRFALISGMSGSGKSSLARAGVLPLLTRPGVAEGIGVWKHAIMRPGAGDACKALLCALKAAGMEFAAEVTPQAETLVEAVETWLIAEAGCRHAEDRLNLETRIDSYEKEGRDEDATRCREMLAALVPPAAALALVIDQLEELVAQPEAERTEFAKLVTALVESGRVWVLATMRADRFASLRDVPALAALCEGDGVYTLLPPDRTAIGQMIRRPALAAGLMFEVDARTGERLDELLRDGALSDPTCLPLLQFTLEELFRRRDASNVLVLAAYRELGGIEGSVGRRAEEVFQALPSLLRSVADIGENGAVRRWAPSTAVEADEAASALAAALVEARLLVRDSAPDGAAVLSVAHEALLRAWPRAAEWCATNLEFLRLRAHLRAAGILWREEGGSPDFLLADGKPLADAEALLAADAASLDAPTTEFIECSSRHRRRERNKTLRRIRAVAAVFALLAICAAGAAVFGFVQKRAAEQRAVALRSALAEADIQLAARMVDSGAPDRALAPLARAIGINGAAAWRTATLLKQRGWFLPDGPAVHQDGAVRSVAFSPNERTFAVAGNSKFARLYDAATGSPAGPELRHADTVWKVAFSPDGSLVATGSEDATARLWRAADGVPVGEPLHHSAPVTGVKFSPDGKFLLTACGMETAGSEAGTVRLWDVSTGKPHGAPLDCGTAILDMTFSPDGKRLAAGMLDGSVKVWDAQEGRLVFSVPPGDGGIESLEFSRAGDALLTAATNGLARIYSLLPEGGNPLTFDGHEGPLASACFSPDGTTVATSSADGTARIWDAAKGALIRKIGAGGFVQSAVFSPDGKSLLTLSQYPTKESSVISTTLRLWEVATGKEISTPLSAAWPAHDFTFDRSGRRILVGWDDGEASVVGLQPATGIVRSTSLPAAPSRIADAGGGRVGFIGPEGEYWIGGVAPADGSLLWIERFSVLPCALASCPQGDLLAIGLDDGRMLFRRLSSGAAAAPEAQTGHSIAQITFSNDGQKVLSVPSTNDSEPANVSVRNLRAPKATPVELPHPDRVCDAQFSPDGSELLTACSDKIARVWDLSAKRVRLNLPHDGKVTSGSWSTDGKRFVTASEGLETSYAQVWSTADGRPVGTRMIGAANGGAEFSPAGDVVATWNPAARPRLWDTRTGKALGLPIPHDGADRPIFVGGGKFLLTASSPISGMLFEGGQHGIGVWDVASGMPVCDFIQTGDGEIKLIQTAGRAVFVKGTPQLFEMELPPSTPAPSWLAARAQAAGRWKMLDGGSLERVTRPYELWLKAAEEPSQAGGAWREYLKR